MNLYTATADSVNLVFARLILDAGLPETVAAAHAMGVESPLKPVCSLATGSIGISPSTRHRASRRSRTAGCTASPTP